MNPLSVTATFSRFAGDELSAFTSVKKTTWKH